MELNSKDPNWLDIDPTLLNLPAVGGRGIISRAPQNDGCLLDAGITDREVPVPRMGQEGLFRLMTTGVADASPARQTSAQPTPPIQLRVVPQSRSEIVNRAANVVIAVVSLVILSPVMMLVALAIRLTSRGPVFYVQTRVGMDRRRRPATAVFDRRTVDVGGRAFRIIKFRSMRVDAEDGTGAVWATKSDPRVTPIGNFLRKTRLDELPQLINVIRGDMNIVGPRPERPSIFAELRRNIESYPLRQQARPGITGWAQIHRAYDSTIDDVRAKVEFDLEYLDRQSMLEDLKIMARTLPVMLFKRGAC
ncbi:MAG: sugar transferase [Gemmatimonadaceae bacterium]